MTKSWRWKIYKIYVCFGSKFWSVNHYPIYVSWSAVFPVCQRTTFSLQKWHKSLHKCTRGQKKIINSAQIVHTNFTKGHKKSTESLQEDSKTTLLACWEPGSIPPPTPPPCLTDIPPIPPPSPLNGCHTNHNIMSV